MGRYTGKQCRLVSMSFLTGSYFVVELVVGYATNSMALVADSFHMLSDLVALVIAFISVKMAPKRWTKNTFGWARAEVLGALVNAVFLIALCFSILVESLKRFADPTPLLQPVLILYVGSFGLLVNLLGLVLFLNHGGHSGHSHGPSKKDQQALPVYDDILDEEVRIQRIRYHATQDIKIDGAITEAKDSKDEPKIVSSSQMNMRGVFLHILADALGSVIVIASALIVWLTDWSFRLYVDPTLSVIMVILISRSTWPLLKQSSLIMLQTVPTHIEVNKLKKRLLNEVEEVRSVHEFHIWQLAGDKIIASAHIMCKNLDDYVEIASKVKKFFHREGIHSITVQPEFAEIEENPGECTFECPPPTNCAEQTCCGAYKDYPEENSQKPHNGPLKNGRQPAEHVLTMDSGVTNENCTA